MNIFFHDEWILDSSWHIHICSRKEYFDIFQENKTCFVSLSNGSTCHVTGVMTVNIKMFDGVVHTLGGVTYVPKMRRNLISLGRLDSKGYRYLAVGGAKKITRGCLVLMKREKCGNGLYRLMRNTVIMFIWHRWVIKNGVYIITCVSVKSLL